MPPAIFLGDKLATRATARAKKLDMTLSAYVRQCVSSDLNKATFRAIQAPKTNAKP